MTKTEKNQLAALLIKYNMELKEKDLLATKKYIATNDNKALEEMNNILDIENYVEFLLKALDNE